MACASAWHVLLCACINLEKHRKDIEPVLDDAFDQVIAEMRGQNDAASDEKCKMALASLYQAIRVKADAGAFLVPQHSVRLAGTRCTISKYCGIEAVEDALD